jgi:flagellar motor switch protein FliG
MTSQFLADDIPGSRRASILLISLGAEVAARVLKECNEKAVERLTMEMVNTFGVSGEEQKRVLDHAFGVVSARDGDQQGGPEYVRDMLIRAMGRERGEEMLMRLMGSPKQKGFDFLNEADPEPAAAMLKNEHPQAVALILSRLRAQKAAKILSKLEPDMQADVAARIASLERIAPEVVQEVEQNLQKRLANTVTRDDAAQEFGGIDSLVRILNMERGIEKRILEGLSRTDPELAEQIKNQLFVFDDIIKLDDRAIQRVLRDVDSKDLVLAFRGAKSEVREHIQKNMSKRAAESLQEEMALMRPVRLSSIEAAQQRILTIIRRLEESEEIVLARETQGDVLI